MLENKLSTTFNVLDVAVVTTGYLKGYAIGQIEFNYDDKTTQHDFMYRVYDLGSGECDKLMSVDHGYKIPSLDELWVDIEKEVTRLVKEQIDRRLSYLESIKIP